MSLQNDEGPTADQAVEPSEQSKSSSASAVSPKRADNRNIPLVGVKVDEKTGTARFWCEHCRCEHAHGAGNFAWLGIPLLGHRVAHCHVPASPYERTGYILVAAP
jgi:hypothetical protein